MTFQGKLSGCRSQIEFFDSADKPGLVLPQGDDQASADNQKAAQEDSAAGRLSEDQPGDELSGEEEEHDIEAEQASEVPGGRIHEPSVREEHASAEDEQDGADRRAGAMKRCSDESVASRF